MKNVSDPLLYPQAGRNSPRRPSDVLLGPLMLFMPGIVHVHLCSHGDTPREPAHLPVRRGADLGLAPQVAQVRLEDVLLARVVDDVGVGEGGAAAMAGRRGVCSADGDERVALGAAVGAVAVWGGAVALG